MSSKSCLDGALRLLGRKQYSRGQLVRKLSDRGFTAADIEASVNRCLQWGYLNDDAYAQTVIRQLKRKGFGTAYIRRMLSTKELAPEIVEAALESAGLGENELEGCRDALCRKVNGRALSADPSRDKIKLYRFLYRRGFSSETICRVLEDFFASQR